jgi:predicted transposase/invertase (TIGR01784 family)
MLIKKIELIAQNVHFLLYKDYIIPKRTMNCKTSISKPESPINCTRYINPYTDFGFKKLFGLEANKDLLQDFLQTLLNVECDAKSGVVRPKPKSEQMRIASLRYLNAEMLGRSANDRKAVYDLHCETTRGEKFIVEIQRAPQKFFKDRTLYYSTFPIQSQAKKGVDWDYELNAVYMIAILDFEFPEDKAAVDKYLYRVKLSDVETHEVFYDKLTFVYMEMPKFKKTEAELVTNFDKWMYALKNLAKLSERPVALQNRVFQKFFDQAEIAQLTAEEHYEYQEALKTYWDYNSTVKFAIERAEKMVAGINKVLAEKEKVLAKKDEVLAKKDEALAKKDEVIAEKEKVLAKKDEAIAEKDAEIAQLKQQLMNNEK